MNQLALSLEEPAGAPTSWMQCPSVLPEGARWRIVHHAGHAIGFVLVRSRRRSIGLTIGDDGLRVSAPNWISLGQVDAAVIEKSAWILAKMRDWQARKAKMSMASTCWQSGGTLPYLGCKIVLRLGLPPEAPVRSSALFGGDADAPQHETPLWLPLPAHAEPARIRDMAQAWLQSRAHAWFDQRMTHFLTVSGLTIRRWRLSSASTRWGSCTSDGNIMLNWRLIHFSPTVIDYVIAHELAHLRQMNHSRDFWQEVGSLYPDYLTARQMLKGHTPDHMPDL